MVSCVFCFFLFSHLECNRRAVENYKGVGVKELWAQVKSCSALLSSVIFNGIC